jgi:hypothetical protein
MYYVFPFPQATGTIRFYPGDPLRLKMKHDFCPLNNKVMELRKVSVLWLEQWFRACVRCSVTCVQTWWPEVSGVSSILTRILLYPYGYSPVLDSTSGVLLLGYCCWSSHVTQHYRSGTAAVHVR